MRSSLRSSLAVSFLLFLSLVAWSVSSPIGSGVDADFHLGSIWCARGEVKGLCEPIHTTAQSGPTARVPFMFQMCNGRNIYFWPYCEVAKENPGTQVIRIAPSYQQSLYYWTTHAFASSDVNRSVVLIRLFNSAIATLVFFALLALSADRVRKAIVISWTLTLIPNGIQLLTGINPRSWAVLGIMSSWAFLHGFLNEERTNRRRRWWQLGCFVGSVGLVASTRFDALLFVSFVSVIVFVTHFIQFDLITLKRLARYLTIAALVFIGLKYIPRLGGILSFGVPQPFDTQQYFVFQLVHIPEFVADWWGFSVGQQGSGPGIIGLVGVTLFAMHMYALLQRAHRRQIFVASALTVFILLALFRATTAVQSIVPLTGVYTFGLVAPLIGLTALYSKTETAQLTSTGMTTYTVVSVSLIHALAFYHWMEFFTRRGVNVQFYETFSLADSWWWNSSVSPNWVFVAGSIAFSAFLWTSWKSVTVGSLSEPEYH